MPTLRNVTIAPNGTVWTVSGTVNGQPVSTDLDLASLASRRGDLPSMVDVRNALVLQLRQQLLESQIEQFAANPPANVPDIQF
jgi:hypothetical protein